MIRQQGRRAHRTCKFRNRAYVVVFDEGIVRMYEGGGVVAEELAQQLARLRDYRIVPAQRAGEVRKVAPRPREWERKPNRDDAVIVDLRARLTPADADRHGRERQDDGRYRELDVARRRSRS